MARFPYLSWSAPLAILTLPLPGLLSSLTSDQLLAQVFVPLLLLYAAALKSSRTFGSVAPVETIGASTEIQRTLGCLASLVISLPVISAEKLTIMSSCFL